MKNARRGELDGQREGGVDAVAVDDARVPVAEHARGEVDRHNGGVLLVDVLHQREEASLQLVAEAGTEKAVDHQVLRGDVGGIEPRGDLVEVHAGHLGQQPVAGGEALHRELVAAYIK